MQIKQQSSKDNQEEILEKPYLLFGLPFASRKVVMDFTIATLLIVVVPILYVTFAFKYLENDESLSELQKVAYAVVPVLIFMNLVIGIYIYKVLQDPDNYKKDPPLVIKPKKE